MRRIGNGATSKSGKQRPNLITQPDAFDNAFWTKNSCAAGANTQLAPSGATTGDTITAAAATAVHEVIAASAITGYGAGVPHRLAVRIRPGTQQFVSLAWSGATGANYCVATFNLTTRQVVKTGAGGNGVFLRASCEESGAGGFVDCTLVGSHGEATGLPSIQMNADGNPTYAAFGRPGTWAAAGTETMFLADARLDKGVA